MSQSQLLCTFTTRKKLEQTIADILSTYTILFGKIFVLQNTDAPQELMCTYNIDTTGGLPEKTLRDTISLHRKKETNTLYTINALNVAIAMLNDGKPDKDFPMPWENYHNSMLITNDEGLRQVRTEVVKIVKITREEDTEKTA